MLQTDAIWINSLHSFRFAIIPIVVLQFTSRRRVLLVSPRGELIPEHLRKGRWRKLAWRTLIRIFGIDRRILWLATSRTEIQDIKRLFPHAKAVYSPERSLLSGAPLVSRPKGNGVRLLFLGRIATRKGLDHVVEALSRLGSEITLTIVGKADDGAYAAELRSMIRFHDLEDRVSWLGSIPSGEVRSILMDHDALILPTTGENFGHSIAEALGVGRPVFVTDSTPWSFASDTGALVLIDRDRPEVTAEQLRSFSNEPESVRLARQRAAWRIGREGLTAGLSLSEIVAKLRNAESP